MRVTLIGLAVITLLLSGFLVPPVEASTPTDFADIDAYLESQRQDLHIPGLALVIVQGDEIAHMRGYGQAGRTSP